MTPAPLCQRPRRRQAFSLVEMLVVVAIIGILGALAITSISRIAESGGRARDMRNAQQLVNIYHAAAGSGLDFTGADLDETLRNIRDGDTLHRGVMADSYFGVPSLSDADLERTKPFIEFDGLNLNFLGTNAL